MLSINRKITDYFILFPFLWLTTGLFWFPRGAAYMGGLCLIALILILLRHGLGSFYHNVKESPLLWILLFSLVYACASYFYHGYGSREIKALFFSCLYLMVFPKEKLNARVFEAFLIVGALGVCVMAVYQKFFTDSFRLHGFIDPITYATFCAIMFFSVFVRAFYCSGLVRILLFVLSVSVFVALVLTGTRGVLLATIIMLVVLMTLYLKHFFPARKTAVTVFLGFTAIVLVASYPIFKYRVDTTLYEVALMKEGNLDSSIGMRLQMWRSAAYSVGKQPVFGLGDHYIKEFDEQYEQGLISEKFYNYNIAHYHNQYIEKLVKTGVVGLLLLLLLLVYPLLRVIRESEPSFYKLNVIAIIGVVGMSGLIDVPLNHAPILYCYFFMVSYQLFAHGHRGDSHVRV